MAVGGPQSAQHGTSSSVSPVNGSTSIKPAIPTMPAIVSGGPNGNGNVPGDHSRKSSVHIKQTPPTTGPPSGIKFGSLAGSPAPAHASPVVHGNLNIQAQNPRVASPAHSPSPIPTPISGGPKPDGLPTRPNLVFGGQGSEGADASVSSPVPGCNVTNLSLTILQSRPMNVPQQPNSLPQAQHLRRESSQSAHSDMSNANMNRGFPPNGGRGRGFPPQQHYNPNMAANHSPQPYRSVPHQHMGRGMAPAFQPQGPMQQNSPYRQNRSPAITPATMHQQAHLANPQGMPFYQGQPYGQPVRIPSTMSNLSSVSESNRASQHATAPRFSQQFSQSSQLPSANLKELEFRAPSNQPNGFLQPLDTLFSCSGNGFDQYLTALPNQAMYGMPPQGYDMYNGHYGQGYGLQQSIHYPGVPASPGRAHGFPQQMGAPYGVPGPYGQPPQAQGMSRTPSNMSERPPSAVPQPSTPAMTNVNHISHTHTPSVTAASPAPSSTFERPKKQSKAIVIKNG